MKLSQSCQALVEGFLVFVTFIVCNSQLGLEKLEALYFISSPFLHVLGSN